GTNAMGVGYGVIASGTSANGMGFGVTASGTNSTAVGHTAQALATSSTVIGYDSCAATSATYSVAVGYCAKVSNTDTTAVGVASCAIQVGASAFGRSSCATRTGSTAIGYYTKAITSDYTTAVGGQSCATGLNATAMGRIAKAMANYSQAYGYYACTLAVNSTAIGFCSSARIANTTNITGALISKKDTGHADETEAAAFYQYSSAETTLMTKEIDLEVAACHTITIPAGATFWVNEMGVISTVVDTLTTQATVSIGCATDCTDYLLDNLQTVELTAAKKRERYIPNNAEDGLQTITVEIATGATATTAKGRFYFKGMLVEDE
ncbi:MAG: hypothetical protein QF535_08195, partial [Anaerolineales bacterium]|nr:hypothetical protein [Anaerolineales bacterium]